MSDRLFVSPTWVWFGLHIRYPSAKEGSAQQAEAADNDELGERMPADEWNVGDEDTDFRGSYACETVTRTRMNRVRMRRSTQSKRGFQ